MPGTKVTNILSNGDLMVIYYGRTRKKKSLYKEIRAKHFTVSYLINLESKPPNFFQTYEKSPRQSYISDNLAQPDKGGSTLAGGKTPLKPALSRRASAIFTVDRPGKERCLTPRKRGSLCVCVCLVFLVCLRCMFQKEHENEPMDEEIALIKSSFCNCKSRLLGL